MKDLKQTKFSFIGGGIIARVFLERLIKSGSSLPQNIIASDVKPERLKELKQSFGINITENNCECGEFGDIIFLAVPPNQIKIVLSEDCKEIINKQLVISLAAAIPTWLIESVLCKETPVVRVIPNTPSLVGEGMNPYTFGKFVTENQKLFIEKLLSIFGKAIHLSEEKMNIATALSAVGPTYFFPAIKALKDFALKNGMNEKDAVELISQTISGTADLVKETGKDPDELKLMIGTRTIDEEIVKDTFTKAVEEAFSKVNYATKKLTE